MEDRQLNSPHDYPGRWWRHIDDGKIQCELCPRDCQLQEGQRGACFVRQRLNNQMCLTTWGRSSGFCIDPIEKKPLHHFFPGSSILSFGTAGCNLTCKFCQNHDISRSRDMDRIMQVATPQAIASAAKANNSLSLAYTYNDPVIFAEYAMDVASECRAQGIYNVAVTAGYIHSQPRKEFFALMDATNVDLKSFSDDFYYKLCSARLQPVLETLQYIYHDTDCWLEITTLLIPTQNDSDAEISELANWIYRELGADVPLHFSAFHPDWRMQDLPRTPAATLFRARQIAIDAGLQYVYCGNVTDVHSGSSYCPHCHKLIIERSGYTIGQYYLDENGQCVHCQGQISGRFSKFTSGFGSRRIPVKIA